MTVLPRTDSSTAQWIAAAGLALLMCVVCGRHAGAVPVPELAGRGAAQPSVVEAVRHGQRWLTSVGEAVELAGRDGRYVLVDLYADWCGWCKVLEREVLTTPAFLAWAQDFVLLWTDVEDGAEGSDLQDRFGVASLPTTLILTSDLVKVGAIEGFQATGTLIAAIESEIAAWEALGELFEKVRRSEDLELQHRLAEDFHERGDGGRAAVLYERILEQARGGDAAWLSYQAADARRLGGELGAAERHLERGRRTARELSDRALLERFDLLEYRIAQDRGDCGAVASSLEHFLARHPYSAWSRQARRTLDEIRRSGGMEC